MIESEDNSRYHRFLRLFYHLSLFDDSFSYKGLRTEYFWRKTLISLIPITEDNFGSIIKFVGFRVSDILPSAFIHYL